MNPLVLIPARLAATRLPNKPLADIAGKPMIVHVAERAREADLGPVSVATDAASIAEAVRAHGFSVVMTRADHPSGSDRVHEAAGLIDPDGRHDVILNLQGDLPTIPPETIRRAGASLTSPDTAIGTLVTPMTAEEAESDSMVKMIGAEIGPDAYRALYFTRARAPWGEGPFWHHVGLYAWRRAALARFVALPPSPLERREKLEQLRALEAGMRIDALVVAASPPGVDTPEDLERTRATFRAGLA